ncbi:MAG TPA: hypothetical protein VKP67_28650 [Xanthobacteraceae bacterium]|nr:hypothetical protein [Xanthobacteraceae bacterium]
MAFIKLVRGKHTDARIDRANEKLDAQGREPGEDPGNDAFYQSGQGYAVRKTGRPQESRLRRTPIDYPRWQKISRV